jgi:hypothetical protein
MFAGSTGRPSLSLLDVAITLSCSQAVRLLCLPMCLHVRDCAVMPCTAYAHRPGYGRDVSCPWTRRGVLAILLCILYATDWLFWDMILFGARHILGRATDAGYDFTASLFDQRGSSKD